MLRSKLSRSLMAVVAGACFAGMAVADGKGDHDLARQAVEAGEVLPLSTVLSRLERDYPGQVLAVELERDEERWIYEIKMIRQGGGMSKLKLDARDASLIEIRSKGLKSDRRPKEAN